MADVRPFRGLRYSELAGADLAAVLAPPYDVIPEDQVRRWQDRSAFNVTWLTRPGGDYEQAARTLRDWRAGDVLAEEPGPAFYVHEQAWEGRRRRGVIGAVRLAPWEAGQVLPHERTHRGPKEDRLRLYRATGTALEPIWLLFESAGGDVGALMDAAMQGPPALDVEGTEGDRNRLWPLTGAAEVQRAQSAFRDRQLLVADGHHRYETALAYADEIGAGPDHPSRFTMALLTELEDPGLSVLPTHRVMRSAPVRVTGGEPQTSLEATLAAVEGRVAAGHYAGGQFQLLPLEGDLALTELHRQVIDNLLGRRPAEEVLLYTRDAAEAVRWVDEGAGQAAFFLPRPDLGAVLKLAREGKVLPQKSTYFAPKPPSGMLFMSLERPEL